MRNPYDIKKISGGSSSGSAAVVSAGLCPIALGVDGGGKEIHTWICLVNWLGTFWKCRYISLIRNSHGHQLLRQFRTHSIYHCFIIATYLWH